MSAQQYTDPVAGQRMARGRCPECGHLPLEHTGWGGPAGCSLTNNGVAARIARYQAGISSSSQQDRNPGEEGA